MLERRPALGKGLSALIPDAPEPVRSGAMEIDNTYDDDHYFTSLATGDSIYIGFKLEAYGITKTSSPLTATITVEARSSN